MYFINQDKQKLNMSKVDPVKKNREETRQHTGGKGRGCPIVHNPGKDGFFIVFLRHTDSR